MSLALAAEKFEKALSFDLKARDATKSESLRRMATKAVDKYLAEAVAHEEAGVAAGERYTD